MSPATTPWSFEGLDRGRRHRVHRVGADQRFRIHHVPVVGILGAGAGPQGALHMCAGCAQRSKALAGRTAARRARRRAPHLQSPPCRAGPRWSRCPGPPRASARAACPRACRPGSRRTRQPSGHRATRHCGGDTSRAVMYCSITRSCIASAKMSVTLTLRPSAKVRWIAGMPSSVAGILIMRLGRSTRSQSVRAVAIVASVSCDSDGGTSRLT